MKHTKKLSPVLPAGLLLLFLAGCGDTAENVLRFGVLADRSMGGMLAEEHGEMKPDAALDPWLNMNGRPASNGIPGQKTFLCDRTLFF